MKKIIRVLVLLSILILSGCDKKAAAENNNAIEEKNAGKAAVTFVELGSVNCVPCKMMQPIMDKVEQDFGDRVEVVFHDVWTDEGEPYAREYGIQAIPTQVFLDMNGEEYFRHVGFFPQEELYEVIEQGLALD